MDHKAERKRQLLKSVPYFLLGLIALIVCSRCATCLLFPSMPYKDSGVFRFVGYLMKNGGVPYRDTFDHKGPLLYLINYLGILIDVNGVWIIELVSMYAVAFFTFRCFRRFCNPAFALAGTAIVLFQLYDYINGGNRVQEYALPFVTCGLWVFVCYFLDGRATKARVFLCGVCFSAVLLLRPDLVSLWVPFCLAVFWDELRNKSGKLKGFVLWFMIGAIVPLIPALIYLLRNKALGDFWAQYFLFNFTYTGSEASRFSDSFLFYLKKPCVFCSLLLLAGILVLRKERRELTWTSLAYVVFTVAVTAVSGRNSTYYCMILVPVLIVPLAMLMELLEKHALYKRLLYLCLAVSVIIFAVPYGKWISQAGYSNSFEDTLEYVLSKYIQEKTSPEDTIVVCGNYDIFYVLADRMPSSRYSYQLPIAGVDNTIYDEFMDDIRRNNPAILIWNENSLQKSMNLTELKWRIDEFLLENDYHELVSMGPYTLYSKEN